MKPRHAFAVALLFLSVMLAGCYVYDRVYLRNPATGEIVRCGPYKSSTATPERERCIEDYERQGFVIIPTPTSS